MSEKLKFMTFPSGISVLSGGSIEEFAAAVAAIAAKRFTGGAPEPDSQAELPHINGADNAAVALQPKPARGKDIDTSPFYDRSITQFHPAIMKLEKFILMSETGTTFELRDLRCRVGEYATGVWRECVTRSVSTLMSRLEGAGVVAQIGGEKWKKLHKVAK